MQSSSSNRAWDNVFPKRAAGWLKVASLSAVLSLKLLRSPSSQPSLSHAFHHGRKLKNLQSTLNVSDPKGGESALFSCERDGGLGRRNVIRSTISANDKISDGAIHILSHRRLKNKRRSPLTSLAHLLDRFYLPSNHGNTSLLNTGSLPPSSSLPNILLRYLSSSGSSKPVDQQKVFDEKALLTLQRSGFSPDDVKTWAWILTAEDTEMAVTRYLSTPSAKPPFILLELIRRPTIRAETFQNLLDHVLAKLEPQSENALRLPAPNELKKSSRLPPTYVDTLDFESGANENVWILSDNAFMILICRLLEHARKTWAPAIVSISGLVPLLLRQIAVKSPDWPNHINHRTHLRLTKIFNTMMHRFAIPTTRNPFKSMSHSWHAQQNLLAMAGNFRPPLELDRRSYRAVSRVIVATRKSPKELRFAALMRRTWPPWRKELDGMDIERSPEEDLSRVNDVIFQMKQAGYPEESIDRANKILGGREPDGTPTVQTRLIVDDPSSASKRQALDGSNTEVEWTARIRATRDVQEAWASFLAHSRLGSRPTLSMYHAMIEKLIKDHTRHNNMRDHSPTPGDGKEVLPILDDNLSISEKIRVQPPKLRELYSRMVADDIKPSGRCLDLLIVNAPSMAVGSKYLMDSDISEESIKGLLGEQTSMTNANLKRIPDRTFLSFIKLLCRLQEYKSKEYLSKSYRSPQLITGTGEENGFPLKVATNSVLIRPHRQRNLLHHAIKLVKVRQPQYRPIWYAIFAALARRVDVVVGDQNDNGLLNAIQTWTILEAGLKDFFRAGLELDAEGFRIICTGLERTLLGSSDDDNLIIRRAFQTAKDTWARLTDGSTASPRLPLVHDIGGAHIHAYVRVLGLAGETEEMIAVLKWMEQHQSDLSDSALEAKNGKSLLRRTLVAIRLFVEENDAVDKYTVEMMKALTERIDEWGGWPTDEEVVEYIERGDINSRYPV